MTPSRAAEFVLERRVAFDAFLDEMAREIRERKETLPEGMKRCVRCHRVMPASDEYFYRQRNGNLFGYCKECRKAWMREYMQTYYAANKERLSAYYKAQRIERRAAS